LLAEHPVATSRRRTTGLAEGYRRFGADRLGQGAVNDQGAAAGGLANRPGDGAVEEADDFDLAADVAADPLADSSIARSPLGD
jgi:hypothetical protein